jgi:hypothetical protein
MELSLLMVYEGPQNVVFDYEIQETPFLKEVHYASEQV